MDITGVITKILPKQSGTSANGEWQKQEFVVTTEDTYPKTVCFNTWGKAVEVLQNFSERQKVTVHFEVSSREYNSKWYSEIRAWKIESADGGSAATIAPAHAQSAPAQSVASSPANDSSSEQEDDLPF